MFEANHRWDFLMDTGDTGEAPENFNAPFHRGERRSLLENLRASRSTRLTIAGRAVHNSRLSARKTLFFLLKILLPPLPSSIPFAPRSRRNYTEWRTVVLRAYYVSCTRTGMRPRPVKPSRKNFASRSNLTNPSAPVRPSHAHSSATKRYLAVFLVRG